MILLNPYFRTKETDSEEASSRLTTESLYFCPFISPRKCSVLTRKKHLKSKKKKVKKHEIKYDPDF